MSTGISTDVAKRLWRLIELARNQTTRGEIKKIVNLSDRALANDVTALRQIDVTIRHRRATDTYDVEWPDENVTYRFSSREYFLVYFLLKRLDAGDLVKRKLDLPLSTETSPVFDVGPAYALGQGVNERIAPVLDDLKDAIKYHFKARFLYSSVKGDASIRIVHPYRLIHTPVSWYLVAFCEKRQNFRNFKLARVQHLELSRNHFRKRNFDIQSHLGDAWWLQTNPKRQADPHIVRVTFHDEAARSILEYHFHPSQIVLDQTKSLTTVEWRLSFLNEFASWLMQWTGSFQIQSPPELQSHITKLMLKQLETFNPKK